MLFAKIPESDIPVCFVVLISVGSNNLIVDSRTLVRQYEV